MSIEQAIFVRDGKELFEINNMYVGDEVVDNLNKVLTRKLEIADPEELNINEEMGEESIDFLISILKLATVPILHSPEEATRFIGKLKDLTVSYCEGKVHEKLQMDEEFITSFYYSIVYAGGMHPLRALEQLFKFYQNIITNTLDYAVRN